MLNVFRMFGKMSGRRVMMQSSGEIPLDAILRDGVRGAPDVSALASLDRNKLCVLVWHYHDDDVPGPDAAVTLTVNGLPAAAGQARLTHYRIDTTHSNAFAAWQRLGSPPAPTPEQYAQLEKAGRLERLDAPATAPVHDSQVTLAFTLPRQAVSLLVLEWD